VSVEPEHTSPATEPGNGADCGITVAREDEWKAPRCSGLADGLGERAHQTERGLDLRMPAVGQLNHS
jgi:hypothetical protein